MIKFTDRVIAFLNCVWIDAPEYRLMQGGDIRKNQKFLPNIYQYNKKYDHVSEPGIFNGWAKKC